MISVIGAAGTKSSKPAAKNSLIRWECEGGLVGNFVNYQGLSRLDSEDDLPGKSKNESFCGKKSEKYVTFQIIGSIPCYI